MKIPSHLQTRQIDFCEAVEALACYLEAPDDGRNSSGVEDTLERLSIDVCNFLPHDACEFENATIPARASAGELKVISKCREVLAEAGRSGAVDSLDDIISKLTSPIASWVPQLILQDELDTYLSQLSAADDTEACNNALVEIAYITASGHVSAAALLASEDIEWVANKSARFNCFDSSLELIIENYHENGTLQEYCEANREPSDFSLLDDTIGGGLYDD